MVLIVDYGSQYTRLLLRTIRELGYRSQIVSPGDDIPEVIPDAIVLSGGPRSVYEPDSPKLPAWIRNSDVPILGICYGMQILAKEMGGKVIRGKAEYGRTELRVLREGGLFENVPREFTVWMSHSDEVIEPPNGFEVLAVSESGVISAMKKDRILALQFHPEVHHTCCGKRILDNFFKNIAGLNRDWNVLGLIEEKIERIKNEVSGGRVIGAVSGGVDSTVASVLVSKAIGDNFQAVFVDHGLLREGEGEEVREILENLGVNFKFVDASELFLNRLRDVEDPEIKRRIIGETFIEVFETEARRFKAHYLLQGTIHSDVVESGVGGSSRIKSHHNVAGLPEKMGLKLLEPLRDLFKDEVRELGKALGIPDDILGRHPFPGPGLAVRIPGKVTEEKLSMLRKADAIFIDVLRSRGLYDEIWQAFAVLLPVKTTGVKGDRRDYGYAVALRAVKSREGMTASWARLPHEVLEEVSRRILSEVNGITRVLYDISDKPPATIEWE